MIDRRKIKERHERNLAQWGKYGPAIVKVMDRIERLEAVRRYAVLKEAAMK